MKNRSDDQNTPAFSRLMIGWVRHRRFSPKEHTLRYPVFMMYLDLDELTSVEQCSRLISFERRNWLSYRRADFFAPDTGELKQAVIRHISEHSEIAAERICRVAMLTNLRTLGFIMNPVTFYYAFDAENNLLAIMPEITNTPWGERHQYVLTTSKDSRATNPVSQRGKRIRFKLPKQFHISPFHPMATDYDWRFTDPGANTNLIHLENWQQGNRVFDATMALSPMAMTASNVRKTLIRFPWMTVKVATGIYTNALKLWLKGVPFYAHPNKSNKEKTI
ncbi:MAG: DUF1365 domain-containing protein [Reinekea sp.]|nr:DUF1365 domain-containing protein [Reinekea sp.]